MINYLLPRRSIENIIKNVETLVLIAQVVRRAAKATTSEVACVHSSNVRAFSRALRWVYACDLARLPRAQLISSIVIFVLFANAAVAASVGDENDYVNKMFTVFIRADYQPDLHSGIYTSERAHTADEFYRS